MEFRKGQGATEYLVLLAVVLIIALVSIALLGFFPGLTGDAKLTQSDSYWRGQARPFQILEHTNSGNTTLTVVIQNSESDKMTLTNLTVGGTTTSSPAFPVAFGGGEKKTLTLTLTGSLGCVSGSTYEISGSNITFSYTTANGLVKTQGTGASTKSLAGKCT